MNIYVAGKVKDGCIGCVQTLMKDLRAAGHNITYDWTQCDIRKPFDDDVAGSREAAALMLEGVRSADLFILLYEEGLYGAMVELGTALADPTRPVLLVLHDEDAPIRDSIFFWYPQVEHCTQGGLYRKIEGGRLPGQRKREAVAYRCG